MSYKLYTDKKEVFECKIFLEGASLKKATSRIVVETDSFNLMFEGTIDKDGNCQVPIKKLKGLLGEDDSGKIKLEVIAEDTYFNPWESTFVVDTAKKIKVQVKEQKTPIIKKSKPKMVIKEVKHPFNPVDKVVNVLSKRGVGVSTIYEGKKTMIPLLKEYSVKTGYKKGTKKFIREVIKKLSKK